MSKLALMNLSEYIKAERGNATRLASVLDVSLSYLSQMAAGTVAISPERAMRIEEASGGAVSRRDTRPKDCEAIWPDLRGVGEAAA